MINAEKTKRVNQKAIFNSRRNKQTKNGDFPGNPAKNLSCNVGDTGWIPGWGTKIPHVTWWTQNKNKSYMKDK